VDGEHTNVFCRDVDAARDDRAQAVRQRHATALALPALDPVARGDRSTVFPLLRWFGQARRRSVRDAARTILEWNPERIIVGHGTPMDHDVRVQLRQAFSFN